MSDRILLGGEEAAMSNRIPSPISGEDAAVSDRILLGGEDAAMSNKRYCLILLVLLSPDIDRILNL